MVAFALKKLVSRLLFPVPVCSVLLLVGLLLLGCRRRRSGLVVSATALVLLLALGYGVPGRMVVRHLEWQYAPPRPEWSVAEAAGGAERPLWIVVLGSSLREDPRLPATSRIDPHFLARIVEGMRLLRQDARARLLLSLPGRLTEAQKRAVADDLCAGLGSVPERVELLTEARDTADEAQSAAARLGSDAALVLVTSACHMPRAMRLFAGAGLQPIPCPTDFLTVRATAPEPYHITAIFPSAENIGLSERAWYECLGLAWTALRGQAAAPGPSRAVPRGP
jgi:uncharacterized SAM-binding protein YcdF (DUF218 family)